MTEIIHRRTSPMCAIFLSPVPFHNCCHDCLATTTATDQNGYSVYRLKQNSLRIQDWQNKGHYVGINLGGKSAGRPKLPSFIIYEVRVRQTAAAAASVSVLADYCTANPIATTFPGSSPAPPANQIDRIDIYFEEFSRFGSFSTLGRECEFHLLGPSISTRACKAPFADGHCLLLLGCWLVYPGR